MPLTLRAHSPHQAIQRAPSKAASEKARLKPPAASLVRMLGWYRTAAMFSMPMKRNQSSK